MRCALMGHGSKMGRKKKKRKKRMIHFHSRSFALSVLLLILSLPLLRSESLAWRQTFYFGHSRKKIPNVSIKRKEDDPFDYRLKLVDQRIQSTVAFVTRNPSSCISLAMRHVTTPYCFIKINDRACYTSQPSSFFCSICMIASMNPYSVSPLFFNLKHLLFNCMQVISFYLHPLSIEACHLWHSIV